MKGEMRKVTQIAQTLLSIIYSKSASHCNGCNHCFNPIESFKPDLKRSIRYNGHFEWHIMLASIIPEFWHNQHSPKSIL